MIHKKVCFGIILLIGLLFGRLNFDIHQLNNEYLDVKTAQINHYDMLCDRDSFPKSLPCKLINITNSSSSNIKPISLWLNSTQEYSFSDIQSNCSFTIIASFDNCYPDCSNSFREIQNGFISYLRSCPLSYEICWPIIHDMAGFKFVNEVTSIAEAFYKTIKPGVFRLNSVLYFWYSIYYLPPLGNNCTKDLISAIDVGENLHFKKFVSILKFIQYTRPDLSPLLILKNIDKAFAKNGTMIDQQFRDILNDQVSSINWLIPIIATSNDNEWLWSNELMKEHFPYKMIAE